MSSGHQQPPINPSGPNPSRMQQMLAGLQAAMQAQQTVLAPSGMKSKHTQKAQGSAPVTQIAPPTPPPGGSHQQGGQQQGTHQPHAGAGQPPPIPPTPPLPPPAPPPPPPQPQQRAVPSPGPPPSPPPQKASKFTSTVNKLTQGVEGFTNMWDAGPERQDRMARRFRAEGRNYAEAGTRLMSSAQLAATKGGEQRSMGEAMGAAGAAAHNIPGVGKPVEAVLKFGKALVDAKDRLDKWSAAIIEANFQFAQFSGGMARAEAMHTVRQVQIEQFRGDQQAEWADRASAAADKREAAESWWKSKWENFWTGASAIKDEIIGGAEGWIDEKLGIEMPGSKKDQGELTMGEWLEEIGSEQWPTEYNKPPRLGGKG